MTFEEYWEKTGLEAPTYKKIGQIFWNASKQNVIDMLPTGHEIEIEATTHILRKNPEGFAEDFYRGAMLIKDYITKRVSEGEKK